MSDEGNNSRRNANSQKLPSNTGPRIGRIGAWSSTSTPSSGTSSRGRGIASLGDLASGESSSGDHHGHAHSDEDDEDEDADRRDQAENWYAGGERSGISVQNPDRAGAVPGGNLVRELLRRAAEAGPPAPSPGAAAAASRGQIFFGGGHTLGSDEIESTYIPGDNAESTEETAIRHLTFWRDGFTVEDGELMRYDDPANEQILNEINAGRAPPSILNVLPGQPVELRVVKRLQDDYVGAPRQLKAFAGEGHRLGSPALGAASSSAVTGTIPGAFPTGNVGGSSLPTGRAVESINTIFEVDGTEPTTNIQLRLASGSRIVQRMNLRHTVGDIRNFINNSERGSNTREYELMTTFPNKVLDDDKQTIEAAGLANSVIVQKWL